MLPSKLKWTLILAACGFLAGSLICFAQPGQKPPASVETLIKQLGHPQFAERNQAALALEKMALNRNLEVMGANGSRILHRWREGGPPWTWGTAGSFATDAAICPTLTGTTFNRNMEVIYLTTSKRLHH